MPKIRLQNLVKRYGTIEVLHDINLEMEENEFTVLVGPSGCGKSTTLRMIAGLETVSKGEIFIDDKPVSKLEPKDRGLAMVFQDYALYPHMTVFENMSFALKLQWVAKDIIREKVEAVAEMLGLSEYLYRKPAELSGGQRQRVAMGRALTRDAPVFLFDEPLSNLDAKLRSKMRAELALMHKQLNKNMIYVTHDQIEAMTLADRIVVMNGGYIQQQGTPEHLYKKPANKFVAGFLGAPTMNFINATVQVTDGVVSLICDGFDMEITGKIAKKAKAYAGKTVILGIRPSDIVYDPQGESTSCIHLQIALSEYIGAHSVLLCKASDTSPMITVELKSDTPMEIGATLRFKIQQQGIHLFDVTTEQAL